MGPNLKTVFTELYMLGFTQSLEDKKNWYTLFVYLFFYNVIVPNPVEFIFSILFFLHSWLIFFTVLSLITGKVPVRIFIHKYFLRVYIDWINNKNEKVCWFATLKFQFFPLV